MRNTLAKLIIAGAMAFAAVGAANAEMKSLNSNKVEQLNPPPAVYSLVETKKHERTFRQQPPMVPHVVDKYQIDLKVNECLKCHDWRNAAKEKATQVSDAHYKDRDGNQYEDVYGGRWFCNTCHAPMTDAQPMVDNTFQASR